MHHILIIATSHAHLGETGKATGVWAEELMLPYYQFIDAGAEVTIASPLGGPAAFDPSSLKPVGENDPVVERFLADPQAQARVRATRVAASLNASDFDAVFLPGGHGTMWDLPNDIGVTRAVETAFAAGKWIATVCHGAAGLLTAKRGDGRSVIEGHRVNGFTNEEETMAGLGGVVPFALETELRARGAQFESAAAWQPFVVVDAPFITGQNPQSSNVVGAALVKALGLVKQAQPA